MAAPEVDRLTTELTKLRKNELIDIIIKFELPESVNSNVLKSYVSDIRNKVVNGGSYQALNNELTSIAVDYKTDSIPCSPALEVNYLKDICKHKDMIIENQQIAVNTLREHNKIILDILNEHNNKNNAPPAENVSKYISKSKGINVSTKLQIPTNTERNLIDTDPQAESTKDNASKQKTMPFARTEIRQATKDVTAFSTSTLINNKETDTRSSKRTPIKKSESNQQLKTERRAIRTDETIVGCGSEDSDTNAPAASNKIYWYYHVFNLDPQTTVENMMTFLKPKFAEVICTQLESRHPEVYSSFKVGIDSKNVTLFLDPCNWSKGTKINRFFQPRKRIFTKT